MNCRIWIEEMNIVLASIIDLKMQVQNAHWNARGAGFYSLHLLFDKMNNDLYEYIDELAERIAALGHHVIGDIRAIGQLSVLKSCGPNVFTTTSHLQHLCTQYGLISALLHKIFKVAEEDEVSQDIVLRLRALCDKQKWLMESHLMETNNNCHHHTTS